jgi:hypothetical protein
MASIGAYILSQNLGVPNLQPLMTFASARPGDVGFKTGFQSVLSQTRYENFNDIVPLLPPSVDFMEPLVSHPEILITDAGQRLAHLLRSAEDWNYVPVGTMLFITSAFQVISNEDVNQQTLDVVAEFVEDVLQRDFSSFARAHSLLPGYGYNSGVCRPTS